ncbi:uncharacterized protein LOC117641771 [Thrips palmi]|uniref:limulus clotting factor C n=1 Tax=Thrips palmi TaxID=161013 RepID=A0A6P8YMN1_THRPL|nr:uncharacterized protein LOC117641771 [Thrips palmi]XP_034235277.1 uncharacterized protein LOC117641771 [Thrips palmi]
MAVKALAEAAPRLLCGLLLLHLLLQGCVAIYDPGDDLDDVTTPTNFDDDEGAGVLTVHAGKKKPPVRSWGAPAVPPTPPPARDARDNPCPERGWRKKRAAKAAKPTPVRIKLDQTKAKRDVSDYHCPESWKELNFLEVEELECPDNATGWFPFPPDCRKYLNCWKGRGFLQACAPATLFHPIRRECDYPQKVKCLPNCRSGPPARGTDSIIDGDPTDFEDPDDPNAASPLLDVRSAAGPLRRVPPGHADATPPPRAGRGRRQTFHSARLAGAGGVQCLMEGGTGLAAHPVDCTKFINCWQGKPHVQSCAPGTLFNPRFNACDHPNKVPECVNGKRDPSAATVAATTARPSSYRQQDYTQSYTQGHQHGGYNQFGNQGYQPPPRQTFHRPGPDGQDADQTAAASSFQGYGPNQVAPPPGPKGKGLYPELQPLQPVQPSQQYGGGSNPSRDTSPASPNPDSEVEDFGIGSAGVIGPLPNGRPQDGHQTGHHAHHGQGAGHSEDWHRDHGIPMPARDLPPGHSPAYHQQHHHHHHNHQHQPGHNPQWHRDHGVPMPGGHTPSQGFRPPQGGYTPQPSGYTPTQGGYNHQHGSYNPQQGGYSPQPGGRNPQQGSYNPQGGYNPQQGRYPQGGYTPQPGGYTPPLDDYNPRPSGYPGGYRPPGSPNNPQWHRDHTPTPAGGRGDYGGPTTPAYPATTTCEPDTDFDLDPELDIRNGNGVDLESGSSNWLDVLDRTRNFSRPQSGQMVRIRGGPTPLEGYVEVMGPGSQWGSVCDKPANWTVEEASIVCRTLGYERGAELAWQGRPRSAMGVLPVHVEEVLCTGQERSLVSCSMRSGDAGEGCNLETQAAGLRCFPNYAARCRPGEKPFKGSCYSLVVPRQDRKVDAIAFSQDEAIKHCKTQGGHLMDINSQAESDFVSEWLTASYPALGSVLTAGVGVSVPGRDVWVWEGTGAPFQFNLWWPGPPSKEFDSAKAPKVGERSLCVLLKKDFPCSSWPGAGGGAGGSGGAGYGNWQGARSCGAEYFYWHAEDCAIRQKSYPYVCERRADDVGCLGPSGTEYDGTANVSWIGQPCVSWDAPAAVSALRYRVSDEVRRATLAGHNHCRRVASGSASSSDPWCFVDAGNAGIKAERCDVPLCRQNTAISRAALHCGPQQFECGPNECIPSVWQCDGEPDCSNGLDEQACSNYLLDFKAVRAAKLERHDVERWLHLDANTCARRCLDSTEFTCKSFSHKSSTKVCLLSGSNVGETGSLATANRTAWTYYERVKLSVACDGPARFQCANGKCINATDSCNGRDDCGDRSDEAPAATSCTPAKIGYELRLAGGKAKSEGRIEVKVNGIWGAVCDDGFGLPEADVVCREAGYRDGAVEVLSGGVLPAPSKPLPILVDELMCAGNETSLMRCEHAGWGVHDCTAEEMVGVRCATAAGLECKAADTASPELHGGFAWGAILQLATKHCRQSSRACPENHWQCESGECVPAKFLCDSVEDCKDGSDEHTKRCAEPMSMRLVGGANPKEGRLEVKVYGEWGTVCDDDFNEAAAMTVCRTLGMPGKAAVKKEAHFGQGQGIIWMDDVRCAGNESALEKCRHEDFGVTNCKHDEDVGVECLGGDEQAATRALEEKAASDRHVDINKYLPSDCGTRPPLEDEFTPTVQLAKVVSGRGTPRGAYPWQASIRVRSGLKSVHWCGAVLVGPQHVLTAAHCMQDYTKKAYFVRVGDHNSEDEDGTEQELDIESLHSHEDFNKNVYLENDLALIRVASPGFRMTDSVRPACMPKHNTNYAPGTNCSISGWGSVGTSGAGYSRLLRSAWLPILHTDACSAPSVYGKKAIVAGMFCAGHLDGGADSCQGDSGGPMVCLSDQDRFTLYGITSWGHGCGMANKPGVYSNVAHYLDWVHDKIRKSVLSSG